MQVIDQGHLLWGMSQLFIKEYMDTTTTTSHAKGEILFHEGDPARHFYTLIEGSIKLGIGETGQEVYIVNQPGEVFGWSSLMNRDVYTASAECLEPTKLLKIDKEKLEELLEKEPANGITFFKNLAQTLGNRLLRSYHIISEAAQLQKKSNT